MNYNNNGYYGGNYPPPGGNYPPPPPYNWQYDPLAQEKKREKKNISRISITVGLAVIGFTLLSMVLGVLLRAIPGFLSEYKGNASFSIYFDMVYSVFIIGVPFFAAMSYLKSKDALPAVLPLGTAKNTPVFFLLVFSGLMACIAGSYASSIFGSIFQNLFGIEFTMAEDGIKLTTASVILPYIVKTAVLPALIEEFAMRGVVMQSLRKYGDWFAIIMSSLVFALLHGNMVQIPFAFIAGIAIGYAVTVTGSMWTGVLIHFLNNLASIVMQIGIDNCSETVSSVITMSVVFVIMIIGIICAAIYFKNYSHAYPLKNGESLVLSWNEKTRAFVVTAPMIIAICLLLWKTAMYIEF